MERAFLEEFKNSYEEVLLSHSLPKQITDQYRIVNILKHNANKVIYLLENDKNEKFILKSGTDLQATSLEQESNLYRDFQKQKVAFSFIPEFCTSFWEDNTFYLLRKYVEGISLSDYAEKYAPLSVEEVITFIISICSIVSVLHEQNPPIIHRDIKPENFIFDKNGTSLSLIDFDAGRIYQSEKERDTSFIGTLSHAAPEQFGFTQSDVRTDIYGIGITLLWLLTGDTDKKTLDSVNLPTKLVHIIEKATEFDPKARYNSVKKLQKDLVRFQSAQLKEKKQFSYMKMVFLFLIFGIGIGFGFGGIYYITNSKNTITTEETVTKEKTTYNNNTNSDTSLIDTSGVQHVDMKEYQEYVDTIIVAAYNMENEKVGDTCETLVRALYDNEELTSIETLDFSQYETLPSGFFDCDTRDGVRYYMAYRDELLINRIDDYSEYSHVIANNIRREFYYQGENSEVSALYRYATHSSDENADDYGYALNAILGSIIVTFDNAEGIETPTP